MPKFSDSFRSLVFAGSGGKAGELAAQRPHAAEVFGRRPGTSLSPYSSSTAKRQLEAYGAGNQRSIDLVADCLEVITETASSATWHLEDPAAQTLPEVRLPLDRAEARPHQRLAPQELVDLLRKPNPWMSYAEWIELSWIDWILTGDSFTLKFRPNDAGQPLSLYRLSPALVEVVPGTGGELIGSYRYSVPGETPVDFAPQDVIHIKRPNPHDPYRGCGIIAAGPRIFDMEVALQEVKAAYFENGTRLSGVLESDQAIGAGIIETIRREFAGLFSGASNSWQIPVLQRGLHWKPIQGNAAEAEFVALSEKSQERLLAKFRVPRRKLGLPIETSATTAPTAEDRTFAQDVMRPSLNKFQGAITDQLVEPAWGLRFVIDFEYQMPVEDRIKLAGEFAALPGVTLQEVREFAGLERLDGDNAQFNDLLLNLPGEEDDESEVKDRPLPSEGGRPPKGENTEVINEETVEKPDAKVRA